MRFLARLVLNGVAIIVTAWLVPGVRLADPVAAFRAVNVAGTKRLAHAAAVAGVRRFVFLSSIGVHGAETFGRPFGAADAPAPHSAYARSKLEAEQALHAIARRHGLEVVVLRPPLVYGPHAPGNFATLVRAVRRGVPLPLGAVRNRRSLVGLDNLVDLIGTGAEEHVLDVVAAARPRQASS